MFFRQWSLQCGADIFSAKLPCKNYQAGQLSNTSCRQSRGLGGQAAHCSLRVGSVSDNPSSPNSLSRKPKAAGETPFDTSSASQLSDSTVCALCMTNCQYLRSHHLAFAPLVAHPPAPAPAVPLPGMLCILDCHAFCAGTVVS